MVQSGGSQPVALIPAKLVDPVGAAAGGSPGASAAAAIGTALNSTFFLPESLMAWATAFASLAFGAAAFRASNFSSGIG